MTKSFKITLLFVLIFLIGVIGFVAYINVTLNKKSEIETQHQLISKTESGRVAFQE